eukprot:TRINITY_DN44925_c0_g1_i1.p1 TRINITY_DN44925_c0_g1~~TRINITY_DN44925_c0_g1_i1.p1  ORF type:complete len:1260 (+),score=289.85 TRINITY_DN44925_c0_g1_i1:136-3780(+)
MADAVLAAAAQDVSAQAPSQASSRKPDAAPPPANRSTAENCASSADGSQVFWPLVAVVGVLVSICVLVLGFSRGGERFQDALQGEIASGVPWQGKEAPPAVVLPEVEAVRKKPRGDRRNYQVSTLPNGMRVVNVQDPDATQAAFAVAVNAGSWDNPKELPGLAHFCEHMLFLGTKTYPSSGGFDEFVGEAGGYSNAFTAEEHTVYYAEVAAAAATEAQLRFSDFFKAPLFDAKYVSKEVNAIDSEHAKNQQDQDYRTFEIFGKMANPESPMGAFKTGNLETLSTLPKKEGLDPVEELKSWYKDHYCAGRMNLATFGPGDLKTQLAEAVEHFGAIPVGSAACQEPRRSWALPKPWPPDRLGKWVGIEGVSESPELWLHFPLPDFRREYKGSVMTYLDYVVSYGGEDGLLDVLQDKLGMATSLGFTSSPGSAGYDLFLWVGLTEKGRQHFEEVMDVVFHYFGRLHASGVDKKLYQSLADVAKLQWDWAAPSGAEDTVSGLSEMLFLGDPKDILWRGSLIEKLDTELVTKLFDRMRPDNMNVAIISSDASSTFFPGKNVKTLEYYGARYVVEDMDDTLPGARERWQRWRSAASEEDVSDFADKLRSDLMAAGIMNQSQPLVLPKPPKPIEGVPKELDLKHMTAEPASTGLAVMSLYGQQPQKVEEEAKKRTTSHGDLTTDLWYRSGWVSKSATVSLSVDFRAPRRSDSFEVPLKQQLSLSMYESLLNREIGPKMYDLTMAGVSYGVSYSDHAVSFSFGGFAPMLKHVAKRVLGEVDKGLQVKPQRYRQEMQERRKDLKSYTDMPYSYASSDMDILLSPGSYSREELLAGLDNLTAKEVAASVNEIVLRKPMNTLGVGMGNLDKPLVTELFHQVTERAKKWPGAAKAPHEGEALRHVTPVVRPAAPVEVRRLNRREGDPNDAVVMNLLLDVSTVENRVLHSLISSVLGTVAYQELRTQQQLGYVVSGGISSMSNVQYISVVVQGEKLNADKVEGAIEHVLSASMPEALQNMTHEELHSYKLSLKQQLLQPPDSPGDELGFFSKSITTDGDCWHLSDEMLAYLSTDHVTKDLLVATWKKEVLLETGMRNKLIVKHFAGQVPERPSLEEAKAIWESQGVGPAAIKLLEREYKAAIILDSVDSGERKKLAADGGFFSTARICTRKAAVAQERNTSLVQRSSAAAAERTKASRKRHGGRSRARAVMATTADSLFLSASEHKR